MKDDLPVMARIYLRAAELVEIGWTQHTLARDKHGG